MGLAGVDRRAAPLKKVVRSTLMAPWRPYRRDVLECGHVADYQPVAEAKARRCEFCYLEIFQHGSAGPKQRKVTKGKHE